MFYDMNLYSNRNSNIDTHYKYSCSIYTGLQNQFTVSTQCTEYWSRHFIYVKYPEKKSLRWSAHNLHIKMVCVTSLAFEQKKWYRDLAGLDEKKIPCLSFPLFRFLRKTLYRELYSLKVKSSEMLEFCVVAHIKTAARFTWPTLTASQRRREYFLENFEEWKISLVIWVLEVATIFFEQDMMLVTFSIISC